MGGPADGEVDDGDVFGLAGAGGHNCAEVCLARRVESVARFG